MSVVVAPERSAHGSFLATPTRTVLAVSGLLMTGFVIVHMSGNLLAFAGGAAFNAYARSIRELGSSVVGEGTVLAVARVVLAGVLLSHLLAHAYLWRYPSDVPEALSVGRLPPWYATLPVSVLQVSGAAIAVFVVFHVAQLTLGVSQSTTLAPNDPYQNMVVALRSWTVALVYVGAAAAVAVHLLPGLWTGMNALGLIHPHTEALATTLVPVVAGTLFVGLVSVPIAVVLGVLR